MPELNTDLVNQVLEQIDNHPESWDQSYWFGVEDGCGTVACFAGWACTLSGWKQWGSTRVARKSGGFVEAADVSVKAAELLGITTLQAVTLFRSSNNRDDLDSMLDDIKNGVRYPRTMRERLAGYPTD